MDGGQWTNIFISQQFHYEQRAMSIRDTSMVYYVHILTTLYLYRHRTEQNRTETILMINALNHLCLLLTQLVVRMHDVVWTNRIQANDV